MKDRPPVSDSRLRAWLEDGPTSGPDDGLSSALARTRSTRQRPGWLVDIRGDPRESTWRDRPLSPGRMGLAMLTLALVALLAAAGLLAGTSLLSPPGPRMIVALPSDPAGETPLLAFGSSHARASRSSINRFRSGLYVVRADGTEGRRVPSEGSRAVSPAWSPDGSRIAFFTLDGRHHQLHVVGPDGEVRQLADAPTCGEPGPPAWSPDGRFLLYVVGEPSSDGWCSAIVNQVFVVPADGSAVGRPALAAGTDLYTLSPSWGPGGIALHGNDGRTSQLLVAEVPDPGRPWDLTVRRIDTEPTGPEAFSRLSWSPDGRAIATTYTGPGTRLQFGSARVYPIDGRPVTELGSADRRLILPAWSPDGTWLAALTPGEDGYQVVIVDAEGRIMRTLPAMGVDTGQGPPAISPDGRWIAVRATGYEGAGDVLIVDVAGDAEPVRLPAFAGGSVSWQPVPDPDHPAANASMGLPKP